MKWYKRDPEAFKGGTLGLNLEEIGAYTLILDDMYARGGGIPDEERYFCRLLRCDPRVWRRIRDRLLAIRKLVHSGNLLINERVIREFAQLKPAQLGADVQCTLPPSSRQKSNDFNETAPQNLEERKERKKESASRSPKKAHTRRARSLFPEGWQPPDLPPDQQSDFERFADHARAHARMCANWEAAWRTWRSKTMQMRQQERPNGRSLLATFNSVIDRDAAARYVPGSEGPQPITLDSIPRTAGIRSLPKG